MFGWAVLLINAGLAGSALGNGPGIPENITVTFLSPTSVKVTWATSMHVIDKYDVTYKPTDASYRVVAVVAGNSDTVTLSGLKADTQYQVTVAAVWGGRKFRSRPIVFRTMELPRSSPQQDMLATVSPDITSLTTTTTESVDYQYPLASATVRGVEIGIVLLVLFVWVAAIALFFNRWGKIRMLLPYQPDYKQDQLKVPGTAACAAAVSSGNICTHHSTEHHPCQQACTSVPQVHKQRSRINSAIFVSNSGPGIDPKEFFRRHGSVSTLCRKAKSVDNLSVEERNHFGLPTLSVSGPSPPGGHQADHHHHHQQEDELHQPDNTSYDSEDFVDDPYKHMIHKHRSKNVECNDDHAIDEDRDVEEKVEGDDNDDDDDDDDDEDGFEQNQETKKFLEHHCHHHHHQRTDKNYHIV